MFRINLIRWVALCIAVCMYRFKVINRKWLPQEGAAIIVCNHVSFIDAVLIMAASRRPVRFIMDYKIFASSMGFVFRWCRAIPIASEKDHPETYHAAMASASKVLAGGGLLGIFPEGKITTDGELSEFKGGVLKILNMHSTPELVPVVPMALTNLWGSFFSKIEGAPFKKPFRRGWKNRVHLHIGSPLFTRKHWPLTPHHLRAEVSKLRGLW